MSARGRLELAAIMLFLAVKWPLGAFARWWGNSDREARGAFLLLFGLWMAVAINGNLAANERQRALAQTMTPEGQATTEAARAEFLQHDLAKSGYELGEGGELVALRPRLAATPTGDEPLFRMLKLIQEGVAPDMASDQAYGSGAPQVFAFSAPTLGEPHVPSYDPAAIGEAPSHPCAQKWWPEIVAAGKKHGVNPLLIVEMVGEESACNKNAQSPVGAQGLAQIMPATARDIAVGCGEDASRVWEPSVNLSLGACYLAFLGRFLGYDAIDTYDEAFWVAVGYNSGPLRAAAREVFPETGPYADAIARDYMKALGR